MAKKVLNVEDDADTRTFVSTVLEETVTYRSWQWTVKRA